MVIVTLKKYLLVETHLPIVYGQEKDLTSFQHMNVHTL